MLENQEKTMETSMCDSMNEMDATMKNVGITPEKISEMIVDEEQNTNDEPKTKEQQFMDYGFFVTNSEYQSQAESRKNAYVIMIIDGSKSFKENSKIAKEKAIEMRKIVTK